MKKTSKIIFMVLILAGLSMNSCSGLFDTETDDSTGGDKKITVSPSSVTLARGDTQQFTSSESSVNWSLEGATGSSSINSSGLLTVGTDETSSTLTVKAAYRYGSGSGTAKVTIASLGATPSGLTIAKPGSNSVQLSWSAMSGVSQYTVQRSTNGTSFGTIGTATGTSYTDTAAASGVSYYYRIQANGVNSQVVYTFAEDYFNMPTFAQRKLIPIANGKKQCFRFGVASGQSYTIEWQNGNNQNTPSGYIYVSAWQNNGTSIFSGAYEGYTNPRLLTATASGFVTIEVRNGNASNSCNYQIYYY